MKYIVSFCTTKNKKQAKKIATKLLEKKLCACVLIQKNLTSMYAWKNDLQTHKECLILIKTKKKLFDKLEKMILKHHSYKTPQIIALHVNKAYKQYAKWIKQNTKG